MFLMLGHLLAKKSHRKGVVGEKPEPPVSRTNAAYHGIAACFIALLGRKIRCRGPGHAGTKAGVTVKEARETVSPHLHFSENPKEGVLVSLGMDRRLGVMGHRDEVVKRAPLGSQVHAGDQMHAPPRGAPSGRAGSG